MTKAQWYISKLFFVAHIGSDFSMAECLPDWVWTIAFDAYTEPGY